MAVRITPTELKEIIDTELTDARIQAFITAASLTIDRLLINEFEEAELKEIERWLAAHFIAANIDRQAIEEEAGPARQKFANNFGMNLQSTTYGQTAATLDTSGTLAALGKKKIVFKSINRVE